MRTFVRSVSAEFLKMKRTPALLVAVVAPYVIVLLFFLFAYYQGERLFPSPTSDPWRWFAEAAFVTWTGFFFPLFLGLETSLLAAVEHRAEGLRRLFVLPIRRTTLYLAKQTATYLLIASSFFLLSAGIVAAGLLLRMVGPEVGFEAPPPMVLLIRLAVVAALASSFMVAIQTWVALLRKDVAAPIGVAVLATASMLALDAFDANLGAYHPWSYPGEAIRAVLADVDDPGWWIAGGITGILFAVVAGWSLGRRDVL